jgi:hypothetical protein
MANITRFDPFAELILEAVLPKRPGTSSKRIAIS